MNHQTWSAPAPNQLWLTFRDKLCQKVFKSASEGQSIWVQGLPHVGKTEFAHFLTRKDVMKHHLGTKHHSWFILYLENYSLWSIADLLLELAQTLVRGDSVVSAYQETVSGISEISDLLERLKKLLTRQCKSRQCNILLIIDQSETLFEEEQAQATELLIELHTAMPAHLSYLLLSRQAPPEQSNHKFVQLFTQRLYLEPYDRLTCEQQLSYKIERDTLSPDTVQKLFKLSGGHRGLLNVLWKQAQAKDALWKPEHLLETPTICKECEMLWENLTLSAQQFLSGFFQTELFQQLWGTRLLTQTQATPRFFSPIFAAYVARHQRKPLFRFDSASERCWVGEQEVQLSRLTRTLLAYLYQHRGQICSRHDLLRHLYPAENHTDTLLQDSRLNDVVKELRRKVEAKAINPDRHRFIKTVHGVGFTLEIGEGVV